jgi:hypothetical protein
MSQWDDMQAAKGIIMKLDDVTTDLQGAPAPTREQMLEAFAGYELRMFDPDGDHALTIRYDSMRDAFVFDTPPPLHQNGENQ